MYRTKYNHDSSEKQRNPARKPDKYRLSLLLRPMENDKGMVLVIALILLTLLTVLGIASLNTTTSELRISGNDRVYKQAFYNADTGISFAVQRGLKLFPGIGVSTTPTPLSSQPAGLPTDISLGYIEGGGSPRKVEVWSTGTAAGGGRTVIIAGLIGTVAGSQQGVGNPTGYGAGGAN